MKQTQDQGIALAKEMSIEEIRDITAEMHEKFPTVHWPEITVERPMLAGFNRAIDSIRLNVIWKKDEVDENGDPVYYELFPTSNSYKFVPYEVSVKKFLDFLDTFTVWGKPDIRINILNHGRKIQLNADFKEHVMEIKAKAKKGDALAPSFGFKHSVDLGWPYTVLSGALRLVCSNGMIAARLNQQIAKKHRNNLFLEQQNEMLLDSANEFTEQMNVWNHWASIDLPTVKAEEIVDSLWGARAKEAVLALPETQSQETVADWMKKDKVNLYDLYNVFTQYITHNIESDMVRVRQAETVAHVLHREFPLAA